MYSDRINNLLNSILKCFLPKCQLCDMSFLQLNLFMFTDYNANRDPCG